MTSEKKRRAILFIAPQDHQIKSKLPLVLHDILGKVIISRVLETLDQLNLERIHIISSSENVKVKEHIEKSPPVTPFSIHLHEPTKDNLKRLAGICIADFEGSLLIVKANNVLLRSETLFQLAELLEDANADVSYLTTEHAQEENFSSEMNSNIFCLSWPQCLEILTSAPDIAQPDDFAVELLRCAKIKNYKVVAKTVIDITEMFGINSRLELAGTAKILRNRVIKSLSLDSNVTVLDPETTWISPETIIGADTVILPGCYIIGDIEIGSNCTIGPHTVLLGPIQIGSGTKVLQSTIKQAIIGEDCTIGPFAHLRDGTIVSNSVRIGNYVEIKKSEVAAKTNISHLSYIGDAVIGSGVNIGAGTITANYDHITKVKSKTVIRDGSATGCNSVLVAPIEIGESGYVGAGSVVTMDVPARALAIGRTRQQNKLGWVQNKLENSNNHV